MRVPAWRSHRHLSVEWVGPRFGPRQLSYQQGFRGGQPLSSSAPLLFISLTPLLHYLVAPSLALFILTLKLAIISSPIHSFPLIRRLSAWGMTLPARLHSLLTAPALLEVQSEMFTFTEPQQQQQLLGFFFFNLYLLLSPWRMGVYKHFIMRGWSLKRGLPAPKHLSSKLRACLFLSRGHCRGFQIFAPELRLLKTLFAQ